MTESGFDQSTSAVATKRLNSAVGGGRSRSPGVTGEVLIRVRESTLSAESSATSCDPPTRRDADQVRGRDAEAIEHPDGVSREIGPRVLGPPGLVGDRAAGVAVVVADHVPPAACEHSAEVLLPPEHRR